MPLFNYIKINTTVAFWALFFVICLIGFSLVAWQYTEPAEIHITDQQAEVLGQKIWMNEGADRRENLVVWNEGEDFPSLGIGHFIWYPKGVDKTFQESFPTVLSYIKEHHSIPAWLSNTKYAPWTSRETFLSELQSQKMEDLRVLLENSKAQQMLFIIDRLQASLPKILKEIKNPFAKMAVREKFYHIANAPNGVYALVDYVNFKGEGINPDERYKNQGWGLVQVLELMKNNSTDYIEEFIRAADLVLTRRVENAPRDESRWLPGWRKRINTYRQLD